MGQTRNRLGSQFRSIFYKTMEREWEQNPLLLFSVEDFFEDDGETEDADEAKKKEADMDEVLSIPFVVVCLTLAIRN